MVIIFKDGNIRQIAFNPSLAARLLRQGHGVQPDYGLSAQQKKAETDQIQAAWDKLYHAERCRGYTF